MWKSTTGVVGTLAEHHLVSVKHEYVLDLLASAQVLVKVGRGVVIGCL